LSVERLSKNPLRILDDKIDGVKDFVKNAPKISKYLTEKEVSDHNLLKEELKKANINFVEDETLVRGLDYYTNLVFEFSVNGSSAIGGGGRYGKLLTEFGGPDLGCIGFAFGIERIIMVCEENNVTFEYDNSIDVVIAPLCQQANSLSIKIGEILRENNKSCSVKYDLNKIKNAFTYAENLKAKYIIIIGDNEIKSGNVVVKNQKTLQQIEVPFDKIVENIA
jgi:histidyl-tRNA synthetase